MFNFSTHATAAVSSGMWGCCKERRVDERADGPGDEPHTCAQLTAVGEGRCPLGRNKTLASPSHHTRKWVRDGPRPKRTGWDHKVSGRKPGKIFLLTSGRQFSYREYNKEKIAKSQFIYVYIYYKYRYILLVFYLNTSPILNMWFVSIFAQCVSFHNTFTKQRFLIFTMSNLSFFFFKDLFFYWLIDWLIDCYVGSSFLC